MQQQRKKSFIREWVVPLAVAVLLSVLVQTYVAQAVKVPTGSMEPNIEINDRLIMEKLVPLTNWQRGDIVVFNHDADGKGVVRYVKRLIGLPGDTIEVRDGVLFRNEEKVDEPYVKQAMSYRFGPVQVPEDSYFFMGDNRNDSYDGHLWPNRFVPKSELVGKIIFRYYPFNQAGTL
ncbi:signal peptidase I [Paenibacillus koleovorans]|uniref:signal peptidase I n=1 Tax=Paenibacillus koleovorans TaxID=121608 RepID=UPI000FDC52F2|nr:signal peptidase I [Paenibacillus koleovorans]